MEERDFLALTFEEAVKRAESGTIETTQDHSGYEGPETWVWYDNGLLVRYGRAYKPQSVQLCGTQVRLWQGR